MADEEKNESQAPEEAEAPEVEAAAEPSEEEAAAAAPEPEGEPTPEAPAAAEEEAEALSPKQARKRTRSEHSGESLPERSAEERASERAERRKGKAAARRRYRANRRSKRGEAGSGTPPAEREPGTQKLRQGIVISSKADKTITVEIESARRHPAYEKIVRRSKSLQAHDPNNEAGEGDTVRVVETRPISKTKRWRLLEVVERAR